jgi:RHS repeat-associated protein
MDYNARYYSLFLGRFISPDTVVPEPGNPQNFNRYSYVLNNLAKFTDSSGHFTLRQFIESRGMNYGC